MELLYNNLDNFADNRSKYKITTYFFKSEKLPKTILQKGTVRFLRANIIDRHLKIFEN